LLYNQIVREENSATYGCYADYYLTRGEKDEYQIGFTADCEMKPEKCDSVLALMKNTFFSLSEDIDKSVFRNAKESLLKSLDELEKTKNGFWLDLIWQKEKRGIDLYSKRRHLIEHLSKKDVIEFVRQILSQSHFCETLMKPNK
jgi:zinc protease